MMERRSFLGLVAAIPAAAFALIRAEGLASSGEPVFLALIRGEGRPGCGEPVFLDKNPLSFDRLFCCGLDLAGDSYTSILVMERSPSGTWRIVDEEVRRDEPIAR